MAAVAPSISPAPLRHSSGPSCRRAQLRSDGNCSWGKRRPVAVELVLIDSSHPGAGSRQY